MSNEGRVRVAPSLLAADPGRLTEAVIMAEEAGADLIHVDVMDGHFVPAITFGASLVRSLKRASRVPLDVHLMVEDPEKHIRAFADAGADIITLHVEASPHFHRALGSIRHMGVKAGAALNPGTPLSQVSWVLDTLDLVLIMSVNPGAGGQPFIPSIVSKVQRLRETLAQRGSSVDIEVDGGITPDTAPLVVQAGANILVAGTAVFGAGDMAKAMRSIRGH